MRTQELDAATHRIDRVAGQAEDQIDLDLDSLRHHGPHAPFEGRQVGWPAHQFPRPGLDRLQADLHFAEIGLAEQPGRLGIDPFRPQLAGKGQLSVGVAAAKRRRKSAKSGRWLSVGSSSTTSPTPCSTA